MDRTDFILSCFALTPGRVFTPVQVQKLFFLIDRLLAEEVSGPFYDFKPYHYGPFDKQVYDDLEVLSIKGFIKVYPQNRLKKFQITELGLRHLKSVKNRTPKSVMSKILKLSNFISELSFQKLLSVIYKEFPDMKVNSILNTI